MVRHDGRPTEFVVHGEGAMLRGEHVGDGPAVVLLHGLTATRRYVVMGSRVLERSGHRVITYDARGHGRSSPAADTGAYGYPDLCRDLVALLDAAEVPQATLAGGSMGAHTLLSFAFSHPTVWRGWSSSPPPSIRPRTMIRSDSPAGTL